MSHMIFIRGKFWVHTSIYCYLTLFQYLFLAFGLQCYQCDSNEDNSCPSNQRFDRNLNALVDCNSLEAHTPGTFCMKTTQQSPGCMYHN